MAKVPSTFLDLERIGEDQQAPRGGRKRPRPDWAEETPLDDLPSLADELLGDQDDDPGTDGRGGRSRR